MARRVSPSQPAAAEVHDGAADGVLVPVRAPAVVRGADVAAEGEARRLEGLAEAAVERDVRVVGVHVEPLVLVGPVAHDEGVVPVERRALEREERARRARRPPAARSARRRPISLRMSP